MEPRPPRSTPPDTLFPITTLFRSINSFHIGLAVGPTEVHKVTLAREILKNVEPCGDMFPAYIRHEQQARAAERHGAGAMARSEEHTSELQSLMRISYAVFCLKNKTTTTIRLDQTTTNCSDNQ